MKWIRGKKIKSNLPSPKGLVYIQSLTPVTGEEVRKDEENNIFSIDISPIFCNRVGGEMVRLDWRY
ncbi:MAG: hypothetical protein AB1397_05765 [bacterium]